MFKMIFIFFYSSISSFVTFVCSRELKMLNWYISEIFNTTDKLDFVVCLFLEFNWKGVSYFSMH